jgi:membrane fusion protein, heavy metal efflux system
MKIDRHITIAAVAAIIAITLGVLFVRGPFETGSSGAEMAAGHAGGEHEHDDEAERGPQGGRMLRDGAFALEVTIYENGVPPELRLYAYADGTRLAPSDVSAEVALSRLGGRTERIAFEPEGAYLRGLGAVREPHSFDVAVDAGHAGRAHRWTYESHEGRTEIPPRVAAAQGIAVAQARPAEITNAVELTGTIQTDPGRISQVRARFPGIVTRVHRTVGELVARGDSLGAVETNESLRAVSIDAPISGLIVDRNV